MSYVRIRLNNACYEDVIRIIRRSRHGMSDGYGKITYASRTNGLVYVSSLLQRDKDRLRDLTCSVSGGPRNTG